LRRGDERADIELDIRQGGGFEHHSLRRDGVPAYQFYCAQGQGQGTRAFQHDTPGDHWARFHERIPPRVGAEMR